MKRVHIYQRHLCSIINVTFSLAAFFFQVENYEDIWFTNLLDFINDGFYKGRYNISSYFLSDSVCSLCVSL